MPFMVIAGGRRVDPPAVGGGSSLSFADTGTLNFTKGQSVYVPLAPYVSGGSGTYWYGLRPGPLSDDLSVNPVTGVLTGKARLSGTVTFWVADTIADALEQDWISRSTGPGVQWSEDFQVSQSVDKYVIQGAAGWQYDGLGNYLVRRNASDGIRSNGCLELMTPAGMHNSMRWARPFCTFPGDRGYVSGDPILPNWSLNQYQFRRGMYGHKDYHNQVGSGSHYGNTPGVDDGSNWQGTEFYIQFRHKIDPNLYDPSQTDGYAGKALYIEICGGGNQEIIVSATGWSKKFGVNTNFGHEGGRMGDPQASGYSTVVQPNTAYASAGPSYSNLWQYPTNEWLTFLIHVVPGHHNGNSQDYDPASLDLRRDTGFEVWVARNGDTQYTKIWEQFNLVWSFDSTSPAYGNLFGFNCFLATQYMNGPSNGTPAVLPWWRRMDEIIFSQQFIGCPQVSA